MKKLSTVEKMLIESTDTTLYNIYRCKEDGIYCVLKTSNSQICPHCGKECVKHVE